MQIKESNYSIADIKSMIDRKELHINRSYQRGSGLWPAAPRSYFIDTILKGFPFPKIYFHELLEAPALRMRRELVDGQQRIATIIDFMADGFAMSEGHSNAGLRFSEFEEEDKRTFLTYAVAVDVIRDASPSDIVEMFRRMNAFTLPLNDAEKRHAAFQGEFKWFANRTADQIGSFLREFSVFTDRQMVRMADQELITEIYGFTKDGIESSAPTKLRKIYRDNDSAFPDAADFSDQLISTVNFIAERFPRLAGTFMMKPYAAYTLISALIYNRYGVPDDVLGLPARTQFANNPEAAQQRLLDLAQAHEGKDSDGPFADYVAGALSGTNRINQRQKRFSAVLEALQL